MRQRPFKQIDVFTDTAYLGNPLAVVLDGSDLATQEMQHFAHWTNLSETTFLLPPTPEAAAAGADYQVRIFTTAYEMPFAGHPTLGSCHAWLQAGGKPKHPEFIVQQCPVGLVRIRHIAKPIAFAAPALTRSPVTAELVTCLLAALDLRADQLCATQHLVNGPHYVGLLLDHPDTVLTVQPKLEELRKSMEQAGISGIGMAAHGEPAQFTVRFFANDLMVIEDPVTGSFNASLAQWLIADGLAPSSYVATQGTALGRRGQVFISSDDSGQVWVGGHSVTCISGTVNL
jgi:PhzF family phenazine biosynthesis protein